MLITAAAVLIAAVFLVTDQWSTKLMALGVALELGMAQYWQQKALDWEYAYWRDTGLLRKQLKQVQSRQTAVPRLSACELSFCLAFDSIQTPHLGNSNVLSAFGEIPLTRHLSTGQSRLCRAPEKASGLAPNFHTQNRATPCDFI